MPKMPFGLLPAHWGLAGKTREKMKAEYELTGYDLEQKLLFIDKDEHNALDFEKKYLELKLKHKKISEKEYYRTLADMIIDPKQKELALLELDYKENKIPQLEYEKKSATLRNEPWVSVVHMDFGKVSSLEGSFELDWNEPFVEKLKSEGYQGATPDKIVNIWFMEVCRNVALEEFDGVGNFTPDSEANLETAKRWEQESALPKGRKGYR